MEIRFRDYLQDMSETGSNARWSVFGERIPKGEILFFVQVIVVFTVVVSCIINLSLLNGHTELWITLLSSSLGYVLPNPSVKRSRKDVLSDVTK